MQASPKLIASSMVAAFGGFLFGFDTAVISGAEQAIQTLWELEGFQHGLAMSAALWGTVIGALGGGLPTDRVGRRGTLLWVGVFFLVSAVWSALATDPYTFVLARFIGGVGVGVATVAAPLYISEISPAALRGRLAGMFQFSIVLGILIAYLSNWALKSVESEHIWRWMLGVEALPALAYTALVIGIPESPRWLIGVKGRREAGQNVLSQLYRDATPEEIEALINEIEDSAREDAAATHTESVASRLKKPILLAFLVAFFNQLSGINAVLYFAPRIFEMTGLGEQAALLQTTGIGVTNLVFTFVGLALIDRIGRKTLLIIGSFGYLASLGLCSWAFYNESFSMVPACVFAFIASHAVGQGAVIWVLISEVFPNEHRALGNTIGSGAHWVFAALITLAFPAAAAAFPAWTIFAFFCAMMGLHLLWVLTMVPETKGVPLEQIQRLLGAPASRAES